MRNDDSIDWSLSSRGDTALSDHYDKLTHALRAPIACTSWMNIKEPLPKEVGDPSRTWAGNQSYYDRARTQSTEYAE